MKETLRCRNCGADFGGGVCAHCGRDQFIDVARFYDKDIIQAYTKQRQAVEI